MQMNILYICCDKLLMMRVIINNSSVCFSPFCRFGPRLSSLVRTCPSRESRGTRIGVSRCVCGGVSSPPDAWRAQHPNHPQTAHPNLLWESPWPDDDDDDEEWRVNVYMSSTRTTHWMCRRRSCRATVSAAESDVSVWAGRHCGKSRPNELLYGTTTYLITL